MHGDRRERAQYHTTAMVRYAKNIYKRSRGGKGEGELLLDHTNTTGCHIRSNHDGTLAGLEFVEYPVALVQLFVAVDSWNSKY